MPCPHPGVQLRSLSVPQRSPLWRPRCWSCSARSAGQRGEADPPCSSYPAPGALAPAGRQVPASLAARYSLLSRPQRAVDRPSPAQIASLGASGLIMSGTRFLGNAAAGGRIYLVPAQHLLAFRLAPLHCLPGPARAQAADASAAA